MKFTLDIIAEIELQYYKNSIVGYNPIWWNAPKTLKYPWRGYELWELENFNYLCKEDREIVLKIYPNDGFCKYEYPHELASFINENYQQELGQLGITLKIGENLTVEVFKDE